MSGGSFDYACYRTMQFADELRNKLQEQGKDPSGEGWPNPTWTTDVACKLAEIAAFADYVGALMKEAEWLYSGDTGEDTFAERVQQIESTRGVMRLERPPSNAEVSGAGRRPLDCRVSGHFGGDEDDATCKRTSRKMAASRAVFVVRHRRLERRAAHAHR